MASLWSPPVEESERELQIMKRVKKRPLFAFFRRHRHELLDEATQTILVEAYGKVARGKPAIEPGRMALAMLMQAAFGVPDHEVPELTACDSRWQMVLDCVGAEEPLFCQGSVFNFRMRCIAHGLVQILIDRTVALAKQTKEVSSGHLRVGGAFSVIQPAALL